MTQPVNIYELHRAAAQEAAVSLDQRWKDMQRSAKGASTEIDALTRSEASAYIQMRRVYEQEVGSLVPSLACR